jgi:hypothetical protein
VRKNVSASRKESRAVSVDGRSRFQRTSVGTRLTQHRANISDESSSPGPESEDEDEEANPYPLEGKYKDEDDRERHGVFCCNPVIAY